jgi:hypothetical protein
MSILKKPLEKEKDIAIAAAAMGLVLAISRWKDGRPNELRGVVARFRRR